MKAKLKKKVKGAKAPFSVTLFGVNPIAAKVIKENQKEYEKSLAAVHHVYGYSVAPKSIQLHTSLSMSKITKTMTSSRKKEAYTVKCVDANIWKLVNFLDTVSKTERCHTIKTSEMFVSNYCADIMVNHLDAIEQGLNTLNNIFQRSGMCLYLHHDLDIPILQLLQKLPPNIGMRKRVLIEADEKSIYTVDSNTSIVIAANEATLNAAINLGIRCCPDADLLRGDAKSIQAIKSSVLYQNWIRKSWNGCKPVMFSKKGISDELASKLCKLAPLLIKGLK